jgi:AraC-like DNA-binding protein
MRLVLDDPEDTGLVTLASRVGLSAPRLSRLFKAQVGVPLARFRTQVRVRTFLDRLAGGQVRSLLDAAYDCGFGSYAQLFRAVKAETGRTPAQLTGRPGGR